MKKRKRCMLHTKKVKDIYQSSADAFLQFFNSVDNTESSQSLQISSGGKQGWLQYWRMTQGFIFGNGISHMHKGSPFNPFKVVLFVTL